MKIVTTLISALLVSLTVQAQSGGAKVSDAFKSKPSAPAAKAPATDAKKSGKEEAAADVVFKCQLVVANPLKQDPKDKEKALIYGTPTLTLDAVNQKKSIEVKAGGVTVKLNAVSDEEGNTAAAIIIVEKDVVAPLAPSPEGFITNQVLTNTQDKEKAVLAYGACGLAKK